MLDIFSKLNVNTIISGTVDDGYLVGHVWPGVWPPALTALPLLPGGPSLGPRSEPHPTGYSRPAPAPATLCILEENGSLEIMFRCHY